MVKNKKSKGKNNIKESEELRIAAKSTEDKEKQNEKNNLLEEIKGLEIKKTSLEDFIEELEQKKKNDLEKKNKLEMEISDLEPTHRKVVELKDEISKMNQK